MRTVHSSRPAAPPAAIGVATVAAQVVLLGALGATVGLGPVGWATGLACGAGTAALLGRALRGRRSPGLGPADRVTLVRAVLAGAVAALVADSGARPQGPALSVVVATTVVALVLDAVDGGVARRTGTVSPMGARFDMEVDAFLILVLSVPAAAAYGAWVLAIGTMRYAFVAAGRFLPWLRRPAPPRQWCKVVAALQGIVLAVAVAGVLPHRVTYAALLGALALLTESFGREAWWLWRNRATAPQHDRGIPVPGWLVSTAAALLVWGVLVAPHDVRRGVGVGALAVLPLEGLVLVALLLVSPLRLRRPVAVAVGLLLALVAVLKVLDAGFLQALDRPFDPLGDLTYFGPAFGLLADSLGRAGALAVVGLVVAVGAGLLVTVPRAVLRVGRVARRRRGATARALVALIVVWCLAAALGLRTGGGDQVASLADARLAGEHVALARASLAEQAAFASAATRDAFAATPPDRLLTGLQGNDVLLVFVESYGRVALDGLPGSSDVAATLDAGTARLRSAGFGARSAYLTSPTFGGTSWLAHSTMQSGLWVSNQERYDQLVDRTGGARLTLSGAFHRAGWRTVADVPANRSDWPQGRAFYGFDTVYDSRNVGYAGPGFGYGPIPDQFTLAALERAELRPGPRPRVMAEVDLVTSHLPWAPLPRLVGWSAVGDGSVYAGMPALGPSPDVVWRDRTSVRAAYTRSIVYSLESLVSFLEHTSDRHLVLVVLGDHQPATVVSGAGSGHDVPVTVVARDPAVLSQISGWGWTAGLRPGSAAPVWRMDAFRDRFLTAFGPGPTLAAAPVAR